MGSPFETALLASTVLFAFPTATGADEAVFFAKMRALVSVTDLSGVRGVADGAELVVDVEFEVESLEAAVCLAVSEATLEALSVDVFSAELAARAAAIAARAGAGRRRPWRGSVVSGTSGS